MINKKIFNFGLRTMILIVFLVGFGFVLSVNTLVMADSKTQLCQGIKELSTGSNCSTVTQANTVDSVVKTGVDFLSYVLGLVAVIMIIVGGLKFVLSGGDANKVADAKKTIIYAIVGIVIAVLAVTIVHLVMNTSIRLS